MESTPDAAATKRTRISAKGPISTSAKKKKSDMAEAVEPPEAPSPAVGTPLPSPAGGPPASSRPTAVRTPQAAKEPAGGWIKKEFVHPTLGKAPVVSEGSALTLNRAAMRARFQRSRGIAVDPRVVATGSKQNQLERMPESITAQCVSKDDEEYWMRYWAANGCSWGKAEVNLEKSKTEFKEESTTMAWMNFDQLLDCYKNMKVAERQRELCLASSTTWWMPPGMGDI
jgi:hypothetical protein